MIRFRILGLEVELRDQLRIANVGRRIAVAVETPLHRHRLDLGDDLHLINSAMAGNATDAASDVNTVVKVNEVREIVNAFPHDRVIVLKANPNGFK